MTDPGAVISRFFIAIGQENPYILAVSCNPAEKFSLKKFSEEYPDRYIEVGFDGQNAFDVSTDMQKCGFIPFIFESTASILHRYEQLKNDVGYAKANVKIIGLSGGQLQPYDGPATRVMEDICLMRSVPNMVILNPGDAFEVAQCLKEAVNYRGPVYIRMPGQPVDDTLHAKNRCCAIGKCEVLSWGDIMLIATGIASREAYLAAELLKQDGMSVGLLNVCSIKPLDSKPLIRAAKRAKIIFTIEEHSVVGGFGGEVAELLSSITNKCPQYKIGIPEGAKYTRSQKQFLDAFGLSAEKLYQYIKAVV